MGEQLQRALRLAIKARKCDVTFFYSDALLAKLTLVSRMRKGFFTTRRQFLTKVITKNYQAFDACRNIISIWVSKGDNSLSYSYWDGYGHKVAECFVPETVGITFLINASAKENFLGLLEDLDKPDISHGQVNNFTPKDRVVDEDVFDDGIRF